MTALVALTRLPCRQGCERLRADANVRLCQMIEAAVAAAFMVPLGRVRARSRGAEVAFARQVAMYLAHVGFGMSLKATARLFHRDRRTAAHACRRVEERRDDPAIDRQLHMLEATCADLARGTLTLPQAQS